MLTRDQVHYAVEAMALCGRKADACQRYRRMLDGIVHGPRPSLSADIHDVTERLDAARTDLMHKVDATDSFFAAPARSAAQSADEVTGMNPAIAAVVTALASFGIENMVAASGTLLGFAGAFTVAVAVAVAVVPSNNRVWVHVICCDRDEDIYTAASAEGRDTDLESALSDAFDTAASLLTRRRKTT